MRIVYPIERDNSNKAKEIVDYLVYTVLPQAGSIFIDVNIGCLVEVFWSESLNGREVMYHVRHVKKPHLTRAKFVELSSKNIREIRDYILWLNANETSAEEKPTKTTAKVYIKK